MDNFAIPASMADEMIAHAQEQFPSECCGIVGGEPNKLGTLYRMANVDPDPTMRYSVDPKELKKVYDEIFDAGGDFACIYHSHTHSPAFPSPTDVERALHPQAVYVLISLADREHPDLRAFRILEGTITELQVVRP